MSENIPFKMPTLNDKLGLPDSVKLEILGPNHVAIVKIIKSRIISKDAQKITEQAALIRQKEPEMEVSLICTGNICSKSIQLLAEHHIEVLIDESEE